MKKPMFRRAKIRRTKVKKTPVKKVLIKREGLKKGIYIIPSLFTCANMSLGILSVFASIDGNFMKAAWFLVGALACDIIDGRIARMTNTTSMFGMQLDSLSDLVSFGVAPAMMMYMLVLKDMGIVGIAIAVFFVLCSALRLARFNVLGQSGEMHKHFSGLPTPASAGVIISFVLSYQLLAPAENALTFKTFPVLMTIMPVFFEIMPIVIVVLSLLMVSNVPYPSFKKLKLTKVQTIELFAVVIVLIILIIVYPQNTIFLIYLAYAVSGLLLYLPRILIERKNRRKAMKEDENDV